MDADLKVNFNDIQGLGPDARMAVVATEPLTRDELWRKATPGTLWVFRAGELLASFPRPPAPRPPCRASSRGAPGRRLTAELHG
ncbi:class II glutamine amidotransferase [Sorangium sp. So ce362]|uniref:class II glutamine amidotransferase n=1 Tax=Sorangium sp. So ce362 TaxID=3133303 RepID=UPI003F62F0CF